MNQKKLLLLSFDLEEFDLPLEYGINSSSQDQIAVTNQGLDRLLILLEKQNIRSTFFVTSEFALVNHDRIAALSEKHEIASHAHRHSLFVKEDYKKSKEILEKLSHRKVLGFRMPRFGKTDYSELKNAGYIYDSSLNPTWFPGRYNNLSKPRIVSNDILTGLTILPLSVTPGIRFPLSWFIFKNIPLSIYLVMCKLTLNKDKYLHLYFHPWEFSEIKSYKVPGFINKIDGDKLVSKLEKLLKRLGKQGKFVTISEFLETRS